MMPLSPRGRFIAYLAFVALGLILVLMLIRAPRFVMFLTSLFLLVWLGSRIVRFFPKRSIENWSGRGVAKDLTPPEAGILIRSRPSAIATAALLWLEQGGKVRIQDEVPPRVEWIGPPPENDFERAAEGLRDEDDYAELVEALYRTANERMERFSGAATFRHYRDFVQGLWKGNAEETAGQPGIEAWFVLQEAGLDWDHLGEGPDAERVKRGVRISGRLDTLLFSYEFRRFVFSKPRTGFFRYRGDQKPDMREPETSTGVGWTSGLSVGPIWNSGSDSEDENPDT